MTKEATQHPIVRLGVSITGQRRTADRRIIEGREHKYCPDCDGWVELSNFYSSNRKSGYCKRHTIARNNVTAAKRAKRESVEPVTTEGADA